jgi:hypothetical protein
MSSSLTKSITSRIDEIMSYQQQQPSHQNPILNIYL